MTGFYDITKKIKDALEAEPFVNTVTIGNIDDVDLNKKIEQWEQFYNFDRPHGSLDGKTPYEVLRFILKN